MRQLTAHGRIRIRADVVAANVVHVVRTLRTLLNVVPIAVTTAELNAAGVSVVIIIGIWVMTMVIVLSRAGISRASSQSDNSNDPDRIRGFRCKTHERVPFFCLS